VTDGKAKAVTVLELSLYPTSPRIGGGGITTGSKGSGVGCWPRLGFFGTTPCRKQIYVTRQRHRMIHPISVCLFVTGRMVVALHWSCPPYYFLLAFFGTVTPSNQSVGKPINQRPKRGFSPRPAGFPPRKFAVSVRSDFP
jgi:hypothetical protein